MEQNGTLTKYTAQGPFMIEITIDTRHCVPNGPNELMNVKCKAKVLLRSQIDENRGTLTFRINKFSDLVSHKLVAKINEWVIPQRTLTRAHDILRAIAPIIIFPRRSESFTEKVN